jgi:hypothetical protein
LTLDGAAADLYGKDIKDLTIEVEYETSTRTYNLRTVNFGAPF